jgi:hypothetical protein
MWLQLDKANTKYIMSEFIMIVGFKSRREKVINSII